MTYRLNYAPETIPEQIAEICNIMSDTGDTPREITHEILKTLQMLTIEPETGYQPLLSLSLSL